MTDINHVKNILQGLNPLEVLEVCGLDEDPEDLVEALMDYVEENFDLVTDKLVENGLLEDDDE